MIIMIFVQIYIVKAIIVIIMIFVQIYIVKAIIVIIMIFLLHRNHIAKHRYRPSQMYTYIIFTGMVKMIFYLTYVSIKAVIHIV